MIIQIKNLSTLNQYGGCQPCEKRCLLCKNYLLKTDDNMKTRITKHKSRIKYSKRLCEVSKHFSDNFTFTYPLDKSSQLNMIKFLKNKLKL